MKKYNNKTANFKHNELFEEIQKLYNKGFKKQTFRINKFAEKILSEIKFIQSFDFDKVDRIFEDFIKNDSIESNYFYNLQGSTNTIAKFMFVERTIHLNSRLEKLNNNIVWDEFIKVFNLLDELYNDYFNEYNKFVDELEKNYR